jgi:hypothetical protein
MPESFLGEGFQTTKQRKSWPTDLLLSGEITFVTLSIKLISHVNNKGMPPAGRWDVAPWLLLQRDDVNLALLVTGIGTEQDGSGPNTPNMAPGHCLSRGPTPNHWPI